MSMTLIFLIKKILRNDREQMSASPFVFTYYYLGTSVLDNIFLDASGSPLPGIFDATLCILQSLNIHLQGTTLT